MSGTTKMKNDKPSVKPAATNSGPVVHDETTVKNTVFSSAPNGAVFRIAGLVKEVKVKETTYAPVMRYKGQLAVQCGDETITAKYGFFPPSISNSLMNEAKKISPWSSFEFCLAAKKNTSTDWEISYVVAPRRENSRALTLLEIK
jgi:hypothetical protein